jgi:hypothetical protein
MSLTTLFVTAAASAATAVIVHALWAPGTIPAAAATPVLISVFSELLRRPIERLGEAARRLLGTRVQPPKRPASRPGRGWWARPRWGRAVGTGLAGFALGATALTAVELVFDQSSSDSGNRTTFLGGTRSPEQTPAPTNDVDGTGTGKDTERASPPTGTEPRRGSDEAGPRDRQPSEPPDDSMPGQRSTPTATPSPAAPTEPRPAFPEPTAEPPDVHQLPGD